MRFGYKHNVRLIFLFLFSGITFGQSETPGQPAATRAELWMNAKLQKQQTSTPMRLSWMERLFVYGEKGAFSTTPGGIHPIVGTVTSGSGASFGARWELYDIARSPLDLSLNGELSTRGYQDYGVQIGGQDKRASTFTLQPLSRRLTTEFDEGSVHKEPGRTLYLDLTHHYFPQEDFYGIGPDSPRENRADYLYRSTSLEGVLGVQFNEWLGWSVRGGLLGVKIRPGTDESLPDVNTLFASGLIPGFVDAPDFLHLETGLLADYRDNPADARKGGMFGLVLAHFDDRGGDRFRFHRLAVETRQYIPLWSDYRRLAFRFLTSFDSPTSGSQVPFYLMESLGGTTSIRGFHEYRFRDRNLLLMSAEYRWEAAEFLQMVLFYDTGKVFSRLGDFDFTGLEKGFGGGVRIKSGRTVFLRVELAHSREGNKLHFRLGPSF